MSDSTASAVRYLNPTPRYSDAAVYGPSFTWQARVPTDASADTRWRAKLCRCWTRSAPCCKKQAAIAVASLMAQVIVKDIRDVAVMNTVWEAWFAGVIAPPRATFQAPLVNPDWKIEVIVTAARG